jgi:hypothetical protein
MNQEFGREFLIRLEFEYPALGRADPPFVVDAAP